MKSLVKQIFEIDNSVDLNEVIQAVRSQQKAIKAQEVAKAKAQFNVGDTIRYNGRNGYVTGKIVKMKIKRANVQVGDTTWNVPLTMLEAV